jgi:hypothetical protein
VTTTFAFHDERNIARIINLALRLGCSCKRFLANHTGTVYEGQADFEGPGDALRRLQTQIDKLTHDDKETFGERPVR